jgi:ABC-type uncharacterized transport system permease subunit
MFLRSDFPLDLPHDPRPMLLTIFNVTTATLYFGAAVTAWMGMRKPVAAEYTDGINPPGLAKVLLWLGIALHALAIGDALWAEEGLNFGFSHAMSLIAWLALVGYVVLSNDHRLTRLAALYLAPIAVVAALLPTLLPSGRVVLYGGWEFKLHIVVAIAAYALFTVAAMHAVLMLFLERRLQSGASLALENPLPPLMRVEKMLFRLLFAAFLLLTATLITGVFFSEALFGKAMKVNYKTVFAITSWVIFAGLLFGHWKAGWRGKLAARWTLIGFVMLLLSYVVTKFIIEIVLGRV